MSIPRRLVRNLSIGAKLWSSTAILALPLLGLGGFYVQSLTSTLWFTAFEQRGSQLARPVAIIVQRVARHGELTAISAGKPTMDGEGTGEVALMQEISTRVGDLKALDAEAGNAATHVRVVD